MIKVLAHRGVNQPENETLPYQNTYEAFQYATANADGAELDIFVSQDGKCFVIHDDDISLHSNFSKGKITELSAAEIEKLSVGKKQKYKIPKLSDILFELKKSGKFLNLEMKQENIAEQVITEVRRAKFDYNNLVISSFNHHDLMILRQQDKDIKLGVLFGKEARENKHFEQQIINFLDKMEPYVLCMEKTLTYLSLLESKHEKFFWTIKKEDMENYLVDGLMMYEHINFITDYPKELVTKLKNSN